MGLKEKTKSGPTYTEEVVEVERKTPSKNSISTSNSNRIPVI